MADTPSQAITGFYPGDTIDITDLASSGPATITVGANGIATVPGGTQSVQLNFGSAQAGQALVIASGGAGGTEVTEQTIDVATEAQLNQAIAFVDGATAGSYTIMLTGNITEGTDTGAAISFEGQTIGAPADHRRGRHGRHLCGNSGYALRRRHPERCKRGRLRQADHHRAARRQRPSGRHADRVGPERDERHL